MGYKEMWLYFLLGVVLRLLLMLIPKRNKLSKKAKSAREFLFIILNLLLVAGSLYISLDAIKITVGGNQVTSMELADLTRWINMFGALIWVLAGIISAGLIIYVIEVIVAWRHKEDEGTITIEPKSLDELVKKVKEVKNAEAMLGKCLKDIENIEHPDDTEKK